MYQKKKRKRRKRRWWRKEARKEGGRDVRMAQGKSSRWSGCRLTRTQAPKHLVRASEFASWLLFLIGFVSPPVPWWEQRGCSRFCLLPANLAKSFLTLQAECPRMALISWVVVTCPPLAWTETEGAEVPGEKCQSAEAKDGGRDSG